MVKHRPRGTCAKQCGRENDGVEGHVVLAHELVEAQFGRVVVLPPLAPLSGQIGGEIYVGMAQDLGLGLGKTSFELGWAAVRTKDETAKGLTLSVCQPITL